LWVEVVISAQPSAISFQLRTENFRRLQPRSLEKGHMYLRWKNSSAILLLKLTAER